VLERIDRWQQGRRGVSFLVATFVRYREDRGRQYGALLSYYGFISLFPLLLVLGIVLDDNADLRRRILDTVYARIPVVGAQLCESTTSLTSSGLPLLLGALASLWRGSRSCNYRASSSPPNRSRTTHASKTGDRRCSIRSSP
jgi:membrane protein